MDAACYRATAECMLLTLKCYGWWRLLLKSILLNAVADGLAFFSHLAAIYLKVHF